MDWSSSPHSHLSDPDCVFSGPVSRRKTSSQCWFIAGPPSATKSTCVQRLVFVWAVTSPDNLSRPLHHPQYFPSVSNYYWPVSGRWTDHHTHPPVHLWVTLQRQSAVTAYLKSKQLLLFAFAWWYGSPSTSCTRLSKELMVFHTHADRFKTKINTANKTGPSLVPCGTPACQTSFLIREDASTSCQCLLLPYQT